MEELRRPHLLMNRPRRICDDDVVFSENRDIERTKVGVDPLWRQSLGTLRQ